MKNLLLLTFTSAMLVACGSDTPNNTSSDADIANTKAEPVDPCVVLQDAIKASISDVSEITYIEDPIKAITENQGLTYDECAYSFKSNNTVFDASVDLWKVRSEYADKEAFHKKVKYLNAQKTEELSGVGDLATRDVDSGRMVAMKNKSIIQVNLHCRTDYGCDIGRPLAIKITNSMLETVR